jgi:hypothetical protein
MDILILKVKANLRRNLINARLQRFQLINLPFNLMGKNKLKHWNDGGGITGYIFICVWLRQALQNYIRSVDGLIE